MAVYLLVFITTIFFTFVAQEAADKKKTVASVCSLVAIILPSGLAGLRDSGIGTDTIIYADDIWMQIRYVDDWDSFWKSYVSGDWAGIEFIYLFINWFASLFSNDSHCIYFFTNLVTVSFVYLAIYDNRKKAQMWLGMTIFLFIYYNMSLNLIRQSIALAISLYAIKYIERKKWIPFSICLLIVINSHNTGLFFIGFSSFMIIYKYMRHGALRNVCLATICIGLPILFIFFDVLLAFTVSIGVIPVKYLMYLSEEARKGVGLSYITTCVFYMIILFMARRSIHNDTKKEDIKYYINSKILGSGLQLLSIISLWAFRLAFYFNMPVDVLFVPRAIKLVRERNIKMYYVLNILIVTFCIAMWLWFIVYRHEHATVPYKSKILGF